MITGAEINVQGVINGDAVLAGDNIEFGPQAKIAGMLTIYAEDPASIKVPESVVLAARVKIEAMKNYSNGEWSRQMPPMLSFLGIVSGFLGGVLISGLLAAMVIAIAPRDTAKAA